MAAVGDKAKIGWVDENVRFVPIADIMRSGRLGCRAIGSTSHFEGYKPRQQRGRIKLTNYAFDIAKGPRYRMHGNNVAESRRRQSDKTQIRDRVRKGWIVFECYALEGVGNRQADQYVQRPKGDCDEEIQQDRADYPVICDATTPEYGLGDDRSERDRNGEPGSCQYVNVIVPWGIEQAQQKDEDVSGKADRHHSKCRWMVRNNEHASQDC